MVAPNHPLPTAPPSVGTGPCLPPKPFRNGGTDQNTLTPEPRFEWPAQTTPETVTKPATTREAEGKPDRVAQVLGFALFVAFIAFVVWAVMNGPPPSYDPTWDYWMY